MVLWDNQWSSCGKVTNCTALPRWRSVRGRGAPGRQSDFARGGRRPIRPHSPAKKERAAPWAVPSRILVIWSDYRTRGAASCAPIRMHHADTQREVHRRAAVDGNQRLDPRVFASAHRPSGSRRAGDGSRARPRHPRSILTRLDPAPRRFRRSASETDPLPPFPSLISRHSPPQKPTPLRFCQIWLLQLSYRLARL